MRTLAIPTVAEIAGIVGHGIWELTNEDGELIDYGEFRNLITTVGA